MPNDSDKKDLLSTDAELTIRYNALNRSQYACYDWKLTETPDHKQHVMFVREKPIVTTPVPFKTLCDIGNRSPFKLNFKNIVWDVPIEFGSITNLKGANVDCATYQKTFSFSVVLRGKKYNIEVDKNKIKFCDDKTEIDLTEFYKIFIQQYQSQLKNDFFKPFKGSLLTRLKLSSENDDLKKQHENILKMFYHIQKEPTHRSANAFLETMEILKNPKKIPSSINTIAVSSALLIAEKPRTESMTSTTQTESEHHDIHLFFNSEGLLDDVAIVEKHADFLKATSEYKKNKPWNPALTKMISGNIARAQTILENALSSFTSSDLLNNDLPNLSDRQKQEYKILSTYLFFRQWGPSSELDKFHSCLKNKIYPRYLKYVLYDEKFVDGKKQKKYLRYNLIEGLFRLSQVIPHAESCALLSKYRHETHTAAIFNFSHRRDAQFKEYCQKEWIKLSLDQLAKADCVEKNVYDTAIRDIGDIQSIAAFEEIADMFKRLAYFSELIIHQKWNEACIEFKAIHSVYLCKPHDTPYTWNNMTSTQKAISELRFGIQQLEENVLRIVSNKIESKSFRHLHEIPAYQTLVALSQSELSRHLFQANLLKYANVENYLEDGIKITAFLKEIVNSYLKNPNELVPSDLLQGCPFFSEKPLIWMESEKELEMIKEKLEITRQKNNTATSLLDLIRSCTPVRQLKMDGAGKLVYRTHDSIMMYRFMYQIDWVMQFIDATIQPLLDYVWSYEIPKNRQTGKGTLRKNIAPHDLSNQNNFFKYQYALALQESLRSTKQNLAAFVDGPKIEIQLRQIMRVLRDIDTHLVHDPDKQSEIGKNFHRAIQAAFKKMQENSSAWKSTVPNFAMSSTSIQEAELVKK